MFGIRIKSATKSFLITLFIKLFNNILFVGRDDYLRLSQRFHEVFERQLFIVH